MPNTGGAASAVLPVRVDLGPRAGQRPPPELLLADPATAPHAGGVLVIDDSGDRKDGSATAHVGQQYLGRSGRSTAASSP